MSILSEPLAPRGAFLFRIGVGAVFGLAIGLLIETASPTGDPALSTAEPALWRAIVLSILTLGAFILWAGAGAMRRGSLGLWALAAFALIALMAWHSGTHLRGEIFWWSPVSAMLIGPLLFIAHELVSSADQARRPIAPYGLYFEEAWKRGVQLALSILFAVLFWGILWLGAALLGFIGFDWFSDLLRQEWFAWPLGGIALGAAVHLADVQPKLLASVRNLALGVLAWLLPVITLVGAVFAGSLAVSGLQPLWDTNAATASLLAGCIGFVLLINAAYQDGEDDKPVNPVLAWSVRIASVLLLVFAILAAWSLALRIGQYGLTPERILAGMAVILSLAFGIGYTIAALLPGRWMALLERVNIALAFAKVALFAAILTPIAPPERLSVNDQLARLERGLVDSKTLDWGLLAFQTGRYGKAALERLAKSPDKAIAQTAAKALAGDVPTPPFAPMPPQAPKDKPVLSAIPVVSPKGARLPESFQATAFLNPQRTDVRPACLMHRQEPMLCKAALLDLTGDGAPEVLVLEGPSLSIFTQTDAGWVGQGSYIDAGSLEAAFAEGRLSAQASPWSDLKIGDRVLRLPGPPTVLMAAPVPTQAPAPAP
jgi:hypothetical protein